MPFNAFLLFYNYFLSEGWLDAGDLGCYRFLHEEVGLSWVGAEQKCQDLGGYLAEPFTQR
jgi:hypothetical protein